MSRLRGCPGLRSAIRPPLSLHPFRSASYWGYIGPPRLGLGLTKPAAIETETWATALRGSRQEAWYRLSTRTRLIELNIRQMLWFCWLFLVLVLSKAVLVLLLGYHRGVAGRQISVKDDGQRCWDVANFEGSPLKQKLGPASQIREGRGQPATSPFDLWIDAVLKGPNKWNKDDCHCR